MGGFCKEPADTNRPALFCFVRGSGVGSDARTEKSAGSWADPANCPPRGPTGVFDGVVIALLKRGLPGPSAVLSC